MQLVLAAAVLAALVIADISPQVPVEHAMMRSALAVAAMMAVVALAAAVSFQTAGRLREEFDRRHDLLRRFGRLRSWHLVFLLIAAAVVFEPLGWARIVRFNWRLDGSFLLDEILLLTPILGPLLFSWAVFYEVDRALRRGLSQRLSRPVPRWTRWEYLSFHVRHQLGIFLVPLLALLAFVDLLRLFVPGAVEHEFGGLITIVPLFVLLLGFAFFLRYLWRAEPLPEGPLRDRLEAAAKRLRFSARDILVWRTEGMMANAAVVGLAPWCRYVFLTDRLIDDLSERQIEAVFVHEVGHVHHHHLFLRIAAMMVPVSFLLAAQTALGDSIDKAAAILAGAGIEPAIVSAAGIMIGMFAYAGVVFAGYSRRLEHEADLFACGAVSDDRPTETSADARSGPPRATGGRGTEVFVSALQRLAVLNGTSRKTRGWQHPAIARRVAFLQESARDPAVADRFRRRARLIGCIFVGLAAGGILGHLF